MEKHWVYKKTAFSRKNLFDPMKTNYNFQKGIKTKKKLLQ
jgi:hypothetical protein